MPKLPWFLSIQSSPLSSLKLSCVQSLFISMKSPKRRPTGVGSVGMQRHEGSGHLRGFHAYPFEEVAGVPLPPVPALCHESVEKFRSRAQEWKDKEDAVPTGSWVGSGTQWFSHKLRVAWEAAERVADFLMEERDPFIDTDDSQWYYVEGLERPT